jgi:cytochrome oxidase Cu insertion factor (SCO1/SenC/PrrC family)
VSARRAVLWGLLVAALVAVAVAAVWQIVSRPEPPPVLGEVPDFALTNRDGHTVHRADLAGRPWIADFIFTRCAASCPMMSMRLARLNRELPADLPVRLVSLSVDPDYDSPEVLERYAQSFKAPARWLFLTGARDTVYRLTKEGFKLAVDAGGGTPDEPVLHSTRFVLVDGQGRIRGYYEAFDEPSMKKLRRDLEELARLRPAEPLS